MTSPLGKRILDYFDLRSPARPALAAAEVGPGGTATPEGTPVPMPVTAPAWSWRRELWPLALYAANMMGVMAKQWYEGYQRGEMFDVHISTFILAVVVSAVTFPVTYHSLQVESKPGLQLFLALQNGFFWQTVLGQVMR